MAYTDSIPQPSSPPSKIHIINIKQAAGGNLKPFVDVGLGPSIVIRGFKIVQQPGQQAWVAAPSREFTGVDGQRKFSPIVELAGNLKREVDQAILAAWEGGQA